MARKPGKHYQAAAKQVEQRPYPIEQGPYYVSADVNSIVIVRAGKQYLARKKK